MQIQNAAVSRRRIYLPAAGVALIAGVLLLSSCQALLLPSAKASASGAARATTSGSWTTIDPVSLSWTASTDPTVTGYIVHWGTSPGSYTGSVDVGNATQYTLSGLDAYTKYYIAVTAYNAGGVQSSDSNEVTSLSAASNLTPTSVTASSNDGDIPANTLDGSLSTRWSAYGDGQWIQYDLGKAYTLRYLAIAFYDGTTRTQGFDIALSTDGTNWTTVYSGSSGGTTNDFQTFPVPAISAEYVRIVGHGNSVNLWNSLTEVHVGGY